MSDAYAATDMVEGGPYLFQADHSTAQLGKILYDVEVGVEHLSAMIETGIDPMYAVALTREVEGSEVPADAYFRLEVEALINDVFGGMVETESDPLLIGNCDPQSWVEAQVTKLNGISSSLDQTSSGMTP
jgi:hypothetical protein